MSRWFAVDRVGQLGVFDAEHLSPAVASEDLDITLELSRMLRENQRPVRGVHVEVASGSVQMLASPDSLVGYAEQVEPLTREVVVAYFRAAARGQAAAFMPEIRTFGTDLPDEVAPLRRAHAAGVCAGCAIDRASEDYDPERLCDLGFFVYICDEQAQRVERALAPTTPLTVAKLGALAQKLLRCSCAFASTQSLSLDDFARPAS